jgi:hypothetical protein
MSSKLLGTAVGVALENREQLKTLGQPTFNAVGGVFQVIFGAMWKSTVVGLGLMVVWFASFAFSYILGGTNVLGSPTVMFLFGIFMFMVMPTIVLIRESKRVSKKVSAKNEAQRLAVQQEREAQAAANAQATANWNAQQAQLQAQFQPQQQPQFQR